MQRPRFEAEVGLPASWEERLSEARQVRVAQAARTLTLGASRLDLGPLFAAQARKERERCVVRTERG
jgi:hypothetical protein